MNTYDWIVVGGGLTGSALSYELAKAGLSVLLLDQQVGLPAATRYSYGGIAYWSGTTPLTRQLCEEGIHIHRHLSDELGSSTQFQELDLVLTIPLEVDGADMESAYAKFAIPPRLISRQEACQLEPLLNPEAIAGALTVRQGHVDPESLVRAYHQAFLRHGGTLAIAQVIHFSVAHGRVQGVVTEYQDEISSSQVAVCAGGLSRSLLNQSGLGIRQYYSHAELIETPSTSTRLSAIVMPANSQRFALEATAGRSETDDLWNRPGHELAPHILDAGAVQFQDGRIRMGQISRVLTDPGAPVQVRQSETAIREAVGQMLPALKSLPGTWHRCLVAFSGDGLPLVGPLPDVEGLYAFSGFSNPFAFCLPLARRFAAHLVGQPDPLIQALAPSRFLQQGD